MLNGLQQHAARAASGIVDGLTFLGVENVHHQTNNRARGVKLAGLLVGEVGELLNQVFVGLTEDISLRGLIPEGYRQHLDDGS